MVFVHHKFILQDTVSNRALLCEHTKRAECESFTWHGASVDDFTSTDNLLEELQRSSLK